MNINYMNKVTFNDRWIVEEVFNRMKNGFYVEVGAGDGVHGSCTYVLEKELEWTGILVEPLSSSFHNLKKIRKNSRCVNKGISSSPETLKYYHFDGWAGYNGFPSLNKFGEDQWWQKIKNGTNGAVAQEQHVECVTLDSVLMNNNAPKVIDYLCLDIEGAELEVMKDFPFCKYKFKAISIELSTPLLTDILIKNSYRQVLNPFNEVSWEHYFIHQDFLNIQYLVNEDKH